MFLNIYRPGVLLNRLKDDRWDNPRYFLRQIRVIDGLYNPPYVPPSLQEKGARALKDIAIYRLQRVEKALERLGAAVTRLETVADVIPRPSVDGLEGPQDGEQYDLIQAELEAIRGDYKNLHAVASKVADRLDEKIAVLDDAVQGITA